MSEKSANQLKEALESVGVKVGSIDEDGITVTINGTVFSVLNNNCGCAIFEFNSWREEDSISLGPIVEVGGW